MESEALSPCIARYYGITQLLPRYVLSFSLCTPTHTPSQRHPALSLSLALERVSLGGLRRHVIVSRGMVRRSPGKIGLSINNRRVDSFYVDERFHVETPLV